MNLKKHIIFTTALLAGSAVAVHAETVSQKSAKVIAHQFFNAAHSQVMASPQLVYNGRRLTTGSYFVPFYIYNLPVGGFVVVSAENKTFPILGYSLTDAFSPDDMGENLHALLKMYAAHIENIRYDGSYPYEAIQAWQNIPQYIDSILKAKYVATDPRTSLEDAEASLMTIIDTDDATSASMTYSPGQWTDMMNAELTVNTDVPLGIIDDGEVHPAVVYGHKGDMYRILFDKRDKSLWRLMPSEILSSGQIACLSGGKKVKEYREPINENIESREFSELSTNDEPLMNEPRVQWHGSGHFTVTLPEEVQNMRVFSIDGRLVQRDAFRETNVANVDLTQNPTGFYLAVFFGRSGTPYSVKFFR